MISELLNTFPIRYFFLAFNIIQWIITAIVHFRYENTTHDISASLVFAVLGTLLYMVFTLGSTHIRHVVLREDEIVVMNGTGPDSIHWADVRSIRVIPVIGLYRLQIEGKKGSVFFFPSKTDHVFSMISKVSEAHKEAKVEYLMSTPSRKAS